MLADAVWLTAKLAIITTVILITLATPCPVLSLPFTVLTFADPADPDAACTADAADHLVITSHRQRVGALRGAFDALAKVALPPAQSAHHITRLARRRPAASRLGYSPPRPLGVGAGGMVPHDV